MHRGSIFASHPVAPGSILCVPKIYFDVAEIYRRHWLEESGKRLENVDGTILVLASGKLVLQRKLLNFSPSSPSFKSQSSQLLLLNIFSTVL